jgi:hypothetical protein
MRPSTQFASAGRGRRSVAVYGSVRVRPAPVSCGEDARGFRHKGGDARFFKELQLTLPAENPDGSRTEPSGRGFFPGKLNGADVTAKDTKRYADSGGWGYYNFNHHEPKAATAKVKPKSECAFCHMASAKKDDVWTQFYPLLDK